MAETTASQRVVRKVCEQLVESGRIVRTRNNDKAGRYEFRDEDKQTILEAVAVRQQEIEANKQDAQKRLPAAAAAKSETPPTPADNDSIVSIPDPVETSEPKPEPVMPKEESKPKETFMDLVHRQGSQASVRPAQAKQPKPKEQTPATEDRTWLWVAIGGVFLFIVILAAWMAKRRAATRNELPLARPIPQGNDSPIASTLSDDDSWMPDSWKE